LWAVAHANATSKMVMGPADCTLGNSPRTMQWCQFAPSYGRGDQAQDRGQLVAEEDERDDRDDSHDAQDQAVLDEPLAAFAVEATGFLVVSEVGRVEAGAQLAGSTRTTSRPSSTSSAVTPIVSDRCWISRHVLGGSASG